MRDHPVADAEDRTQPGPALAAAAATAAGSGAQACASPTLISEPDGDKNVGGGLPPIAVCQSQYL